MATNQTARALSGGFAAAVGVLLALHVSIVAAYGAGGEAVAAILFGGAIVFILASMWVLGRPASLLVRTMICLGLSGCYLLMFMIWD